jgi:predicted DNA-binding protein YlxM (UPF0122 family)
MALEKIGELKTFFSLTKKQQKCIVLLFEGKLSNSQIAASLQLAESTFYNWKRIAKFRKAQDEYSKYILHDAVGDAVKTMHALLNARSEMVRYNAAAYVMDKAQQEEVTTQSQPKDWSAILKRTRELKAKEDAHE